MRNGERLCASRRSSFVLRSFSAAGLVAAGASLPRLGHTLISSGGGGEHLAPFQNVAPLLDEPVAAFV